MKYANWTSCESPSKSWDDFTILGSEDQPDGSVLCFVLGPEEIIYRVEDPTGDENDELPPNDPSFNWWRMTG